MNLIFAAIATTLLVVRALSRKSLTVSGVLAAVLTAGVHALHPWNLPFVLLLVFYGLGTTATKVKHDIKAKLTISSSGATGGEGPRNYIQVFANSIVASFLIVLHAKQLGMFTPGGYKQSQSACFHNRTDDLIIVGIIANYAAVLADTLSSELGILSQSPPRLITTLRETPRGTNGGVTLYGLAAGAVGAAAVGITSVALLPACETAPIWGLGNKFWFIAFITFVGTAGSLLDSLLGALFQQSIVDTRSNKIVEAPNGAKVLVEPYSTTHSIPQSVDSALRHRHPPLPHAPDVERPNSRRVITAQKWGVLSNNQVNLAMALAMSFMAMVMWGGTGRVGAVVGEQLRSVAATVVKQKFSAAVVNAVFGV